ncbi:MAG: NmrA family NAD(P)-binding protein [Bacteroidales bacterium]|nr:NmrA family NAD(P)-binding protein [Bacteroidales bacterium]
MNTYTITGATGNTGKPIAMGLLEKGHKVRIISRSKEKAQELIDKGAELFEGDQSDTSLLKKAFDGADAVYAMIPFYPPAEDYFAFQMNHVNAMAVALKVSGVKYVVSLSSVGAHMKQNAGVVQGVQQMEDKFNDIEGLNVMHLRASYFMENTLGQVGAIKHMGAMASPVKGDLKFPMVATRDIAQKALKHLSELGFTGKNHEYVLGSRDVSYDEVAQIFGKLIGKPDLKYITVSYDDGAAALKQMGFGESAANRMIEFVKSLNEGKVLEETTRTKQNTTPTSIEDFAQVFKAVYHS